MDESALVPALAATLGSFVGAAASILTTWMTQRTQTIRADEEWKRKERESLYREFITEASRFAVDALTHEMEGPEKIISLYGLLSRIRLISSDEVVRQGEECCQRIIAQYGRPNLTADDLHTLLITQEVHRLDPLKGFSEACRSEILARKAPLRSCDKLPST